MKILIIGNGFDLARGLPTKYTDFLESSRKFFEYCNDENKHSLFGEFFSKALKQQDLYDEFCSFENNVWLEYMISRYQKNKEVGDTWIDFEREVRAVIEALEGTYLADNIYLWNIQGAFPYYFFIDKFNKSHHEKPEIDEKYAMEVSEFLFNELMKFTRAFEMYIVCIIDKHVADFAANKNIHKLSDKVVKYRQNYRRLHYEKNSAQVQQEYAIESYLATNKISTQKELEQISGYDKLKAAKDVATEALNKMLAENNDLQSMYEASNLLKITSEFDYILSFNYTSTFKSLYSNDFTKFCYIHGKAQLVNGKTNMIFGIDETLQEGDKKEQFIFAKFKKYFQRIVNMTGSTYKDWLENAKISNWTSNYEVYIIGHSLDLTDHEILKEFFDIDKENKYVKITIFYRDELSKVKLIENTINMLGKEELIRRVHGSKSNIFFVNQYDEELGIFKRPNEIENPPCEGLCGIFQPFACKACKKAPPNNEE